MPADRTVVDEEQVGYSAQPVESLMFIGADRFIGTVAACGDDRKAQLPHKDMVEGSVGNHDAQTGISGRHRRCDGNGSILFSE